MRTRTDTRLPTAGGFPKSVSRRLDEAAVIWANHERRPKPNKNTAERWTKFVKRWANDQSLPLLIRKHSKNRGWSLVHHVTRRCLVPVDNSPAQWAFCQACNGLTPNFKEIPSLLKGQIPVAFVRGDNEERKAMFGCNLKDCPEYDLNSLGWYLGHVRDIGLHTRRRIDEVDIELLKTHFIRLMSPTNMFVVHKDHSGVAELPEFKRRLGLVDLEVF